MPQESHSGDVFVDSNPAELSFNDTNEDAVAIEAERCDDELDIAVSKTSGEASNSVVASDQSSILSSNGINSSGYAPIVETSPKVRSDFAQASTSSEYSPVPAQAMSGATATTSKEIRTQHSQEQQEDEDFRSRKSSNGMKQRVHSAHIDVYDAAVDNLEIVNDDMDGTRRHFVLFHVYVLTV